MQTGLAGCFVREQEVKIATLLQKTREGWGTRTIFSAPSSRRFRDGLDFSYRNRLGQKRDVAGAKEMR
jgi:hypothetical protein